MWWLEGHDVCHVPAFEIAAVDTLGAGDTFHGAFALAIGEGADEATAAVFASAAAAVKCTRPGGRDGIPTRAQVAAFYDESEDSAAPPTSKLPRSSARHS